MNPLSDGRIRQFGCPWHGFKNDLDLYDAPGGSLRKAFTNWPTYAALDGGGSTNLIKVPGLPAVSRTAEEQARDTANGYEWLNYGLIAGRTLHGHDLGNRVIYIDPGGTTWLISIESRYTVTPTFGWTVTAHLEKIFGRLAYNPYPLIYRQLDTLFDDTLELRVGYAVTRLETGPWVIEQNSTGSVSMIHVYIAGEGIIERAVNASGLGDRLELAGVFKLEITGTGDLNRSTLGDGITATLTLHKGKNDCLNTYVGTSPNGVKLDENNPSFWVTGYVISQTPSECPDCPDQTTVTGVQPAYPALLPYNGEVNYEDRLLRVLFDEAGNEVAYTTKGWSETFTKDYDFYLTTTYEHTRVVDLEPVILGGNCSHCVFDSIISDAYSGYFQVGATWIIQSQATFILYRNGTEISRAEAGLSRHMEDYYRVDGNGGGYTTFRLFQNEIYSDYTLDGETLAANLIDDFVGSIINAYSPQVMGVKTRSLFDSGGGKDHWTKLKSVAVPWGSDNAHNNQWLTGGLARWLYGTQDPVKKIAYWYEAGVTDQQDAKINFV